ncbi:MAG: hypothetical protein U5Q44_04300 [Dehalococcoidia bacterium]|nr:hypothetical protein [Dehalococcoidia bacterium]
MEILTGVIAGAAIAAVIAAWLLGRRGPGDGGATNETLRELTRAVGDLRADVQSVHGRVEGIERQHDTLRDNVTKVQLSLEKPGAWPPVSARAPTPSARS